MLPTVAWSVLIQFSCAFYSLPFPPSVYFVVNIFFKMEEGVS